MSTTQTTHVRQYLLPRQAAAPDGPVDVHMMYVMHHAFRRDLAMFAAAAAATPAHDRDAWAALGQRWRVFSTVLHHHHTGEDTGLWPRLLELAAPDERATLLAMEAEHEGIDPLLTACEQGFADMVAAPGETTRAQLAATLGQTRDHLAQHLEHEETDAMALVQKYLTTEDWHDIEEKSFKNRRTSLAELFSVVPWIALELPDDVREDLLAEAGLPMRLLWLASRGRFARLEARATRHL
jgi:Hemerythrin HHE cation binding domain